MSEIRPGNIIVIGNGMVGHKFIDLYVKALDSNISLKSHSLITFCEEVRPAYDRVHLSEFFSGKTAEELSLGSIDWYKERNVRLYLGDKVVKIDRVKRVVYSKKRNRTPI